MLCVNQVKFTRNAMHTQSFPSNDFACKLDFIHSNRKMFAFSLNVNGYWTQVIEIHWKNGNTFTEKRLNCPTINRFLRLKIHLLLSCALKAVLWFCGLSTLKLWHLHMKCRNRKISEFYIVEKRKVASKSDTQSWRWNKVDVDRAFRSFICWRNEKLFL